MGALKRKYHELKRGNPERLILLLALSYLLVLFILFGTITIWLIDKFEANSKKNIELITKQALNITKEQLISKTNTTVSLSQTILEKKESDIKESIRIRVENLYSIISQLYQEHQDEGKKSIIEEIKNLLDNLQTYDNSYSFLASSKGVIILHPDQKLQNMQITKENSAEYSVLKKALELIRSADSGYFIEKYYKPNTEILEEKIYYLKYFKPLDLIIANGQYRDEIEKIAQNELISILKNQQNSRRDIFLNVLTPLADGLNLVNMDGYTLKQNNSKAIGDSIKKEIEKRVLNGQNRGYIREITEDGDHIATYFSTTFKGDLVITNSVLLDPILDEIKNEIKEADSELSSEIIEILDMFIIFLFVTSILSITVIKTTKEIFSEKSRELQNRNEELMRIFDNSTNPITIVDINGFISYANNSFLRMSEYNKSDLDNLDITSLIKKEFKKQFFAKLQKASVVSFAEEFEAIIFSKSTTSIHTKISLTRFSKDLFVAMIRDVTAEHMRTQNLEKMIQEEIEKKEETELKFSTLFDNAPAGILILDNKHQIVETNKAFESISGYKKEELSSQKIENFFLDEYQEQIINTINNDTNRDSIRDSYEWIMLDSRGSKKCISIRLETIHRGERSYRLMIATDVTELKNAREKEKRQEKLLIQQSRFAVMGEMINMIAHQWRQPLGALSIEIINLVENYEAGMLDEEYIRKWESKSGSILKHLSQTIDDFRTFFKQDEAKSIFNIEDSINNSLELISATLKSKYIKVIKDIDSNLEIFGYQNRLQQAFLNILNNAQDALIERKVHNGVIKIVCKKREDMAYISFEDNAGGISVAPISKIFEPYFSTKSKNSSGIGLYMTKVIIESHMGGEMAVSNTKNGALFEIYIPTFKKDDE